MMVRLTIACIVVLILAGGCAARRPPAPLQPSIPDEEKVRQALIDFNEAYDVGDADDVRQRLYPLTEQERLLVDAIAETSVAHARLRKAEARVSAPLAEVIRSLPFSSPGSIAASRLSSTGFSQFVAHAREPTQMRMQAGDVVAFVPSGCGSHVKLRKVEGRWLIRPDWYGAPQDLVPVLREEARVKTELAQAIESRSIEQLNAAMIRALARHSFAMPQTLRQDFATEILRSPSGAKENPP